MTVYCDLSIQFFLQNHIQIVTEWIPNDVSSTKIRYYYKIWIFTYT